MQNYAFSPPVKASRVSLRTSTLPAPTGAVLGSGHPIVDSSAVLHAAFGFSVCWVFSRAPLEPSDDANQMTRLALRVWSFPRAAVEPVVVTVAIPSPNFVPVASTEVADRRALLVAGSNGTALRVDLPAIGRLPGAAVPSDCDVAILPGIRAPIAAAAGDGILYVASLGSATDIVSVTLADDGSFIIARTPFAPDAGSARGSSGGVFSWIPVVNLGGLLGRRKAKDDAAAAASGSKASEGNGIVALFHASGCGDQLYVETGTGLMLIQADTSESSKTPQWCWEKDRSDGNRVESVVDVAVDDNEVWILARNRASSHLSIYTVSRVNSDTATSTMDLPPEQLRHSGANLVGAARATAASAAAPSAWKHSTGARLHVVDDATCLVATRREIHRCVVSATVRKPPTHVGEPHPAAVVTLASAHVGNAGGTCLLTNFGLVTLRNATSNASVLETSTNLLDASAFSIATASTRADASMVDRTPKPNHGLIDSPRQAPSAANASSFLNASYTASSNTARAAQYSFASVDAAEAHSGIDQAWLTASDTVTNTIAINPTNWAKGDLGVEDADGMAFVSRELDRRIGHHTAMLEHLQRAAKWQRLKPSSQAALLSAGEILTMYAALRSLHNDACPRVDKMRIEIFQNAVIATANHLRTSDTPEGASASEITYFSTHNGPLLLAAINASLHQVVQDASISVATKVEVAAAVATLWGAALDGVETHRQTHALLATAEAKASLWSVSRDATDQFSSGEAVAIAFALSSSDALALLVDYATRSQSVDTSLVGAAHCLCTAMDRVLRFAFGTSIRGSAHSDEVLRRALLRPPFLTQAMGYPNGRPRPQSLSKLDVCARILGVAEAIAKDFELLAVLIDMSAADRLDWDRVAASKSPEDVPEWASARDYASSVPGFYQSFLQTLMRQYREVELEAAGRLFSRLADGTAVEVAWLDFMRKEAPHALWVMRSNATDAILASSTSDAPRGLQLGSTLQEHRSASLGVATLEWIADGRPLASRRRIENERRIVAALSKHAPHIVSSAPAADEAVRILLDVSGDGTAWADAARIADSISDAAARDQLQLAIVARLFAEDGEKFVRLAKDDGMGERARISAMASTATGVTIAASAHLKRLVQDMSVTSTATSPAFAGAVREWALVHFASQ